MDKIDVLGSEFFRGGIVHQGKPEYRHDLRRNFTGQQDLAIVPRFLLSEVVELFFSMSGWRPLGTVCKMCGAVRKTCVPYALREVAQNQTSSPMFCSSIGEGGDER